MSEPIYAAPGDTGHLKFGHQDGLGAVKVTVAGSCNSQHGQWVCIEHAEIFTHNMARDNHVENQHNEPCRLAWLCPEHGVEDA